MGFTDMFWDEIVKDEVETLGHTTESIILDAIRKLHEELIETQGKVYEICDKLGIKE